jgi:hypothetical protein
MLNGWWCCIWKIISIFVHCVVSSNDALNEHRSLHLCVCDLLHILLHGSLVLMLLLYDIILVLNIRMPRVGAALREAEVISLPAAAPLTTPQLDDMLAKVLPPKTPSANMAMHVKGGLLPVSSTDSF